MIHSTTARWRGVATALALSLGLAACNGGDGGETQESAAPAATGPLAAVEGLWAYEGLTTSGGTEMPLTGIFLFKDGLFLQQSIFNGEPFDQQPAMAHAGPYSEGGAGVRLVAEQTLSIAPGSATPLSSAGLTEHDLAVTRDGEKLTLVFSAGTGTVQTFSRLGDATGASVYRLAEGALAFADDYFILVSGDEESAVTGYGTYRRSDDDLTLEVIRWSESDGEGASNVRDITLNATFDGEVLTLADGRRFAVVE